MISIMLFGVEEIFFVYVLGKISDRAFRLGVLYIKLKKNIIFVPIIIWIFICLSK